jgi:hypothetical protein
VNHNYSPTELLTYNKIKQQVLISTTLSV